MYTLNQVSDNNILARHMVCNIVVSDNLETHKECNMKETCNRCLVLDNCNSATHKVCSNKEYRKVQEYSMSVSDIQ